MQRNGMCADVSWHNRATEYAGLYRRIVEMRGQRQS